MKRSKFVEDGMFVPKHIASYADVSGNIVWLSDKCIYVQLTYTLFMYRN